MTIEERLTDALSAYREQPEPPPELWERIEARTRRRTWGRAPWVLAAAAVLVIVALVGASIAQRSDDTHQLTAGDVTKEQFVARANQQCEDFTKRLDSARVVFPTATGYAVVADQLLQIARDALIEAEGAVVPAELSATAAAIADQLRLAVAAAERARTSADAGDIAAAEAEFRAYEEAISRVGTRLVAEGAESCAPVAKVVTR